MLLTAEWEQQTATLLVWPHDQRIWQSHFEAVQNTFGQISHALSWHQKVLILCQNSAHQNDIQQRLEKAAVCINNIHYIHGASNDCWARDVGPLSLKTPHGTEYVDFQFNGWGEKFPYQWDNRINHVLAKNKVLGDSAMLSHDFVLEGGSIDSDGQGTLLTTRQCLLAPNRNPALNQVQITEKLTQTLGIKRIHWLNHGSIIGDDTDGHIDTLARFCNPITIAYSACFDSHDAHYAPLNAMKQELEQLRTADKQPYRLIPLPIPQAIHNAEGQRLPANYANFIISNQRVLVPIYQDTNDALALQRLTSCFPQHQIMPIDARPLIHQGGSLHCVTLSIH